jgi:hypothetical protein
VTTQPFDQDTTEMQAKRAHWTTRPEGHAQCQGCPWWSFERNYKGAAALHHDSSGHVVEVHESSSTFYGQDAADRPRWWKAPPG